MARRRRETNTRGPWPEAGTSPCAAGPGEGRQLHRCIDEDELAFLQGLTPQGQVGTGAIQAEVRPVEAGGQGFFEREAGHPDQQDTEADTGIGQHQPEFVTEQPLDQLFRAPPVFRNRS